MAGLTVLGKEYAIREDPSVKEVQLGRRCLVAPSLDHSAIKSYLKERLYEELESALWKIRRQESVDLFGSIDFEVVTRLRGNGSVVAKYRGNKIFVKASAIALPRPALEYLVAHELAHIVTRKHSRTFRRTLEGLYPGFRDGKRVFHAFQNKVLTPRW